MNCRSCEKLFLKSLGVELRPCEDKDLESHLASCAACEGFARDYESIQEGLARLDNRARAVGRGLSAAEVISELGIQAESTPRRFELRWGLAAAAACAVLFAGVLLVRQLVSEPAKGSLQTAEAIQPLEAPAPVVREEAGTETVRLVKGGQQAVESERQMAWEEAVLEQGGDMLAGAEEFTPEDIIAAAGDSPADGVDTSHLRFSGVAAPPAAGGSAGGGGAVKAAGTDGEPLHGDTAAEAPVAPGLKIYGNVIRAYEDDRARIVVRGQGRARVTLYDLKGRAVLTLFDGVLSGEGEISWDGGKDGKTVAAGVYIVVMELDGWKATEKIVIKK